MNYVEQAKKNYIDWLRVNNPQAFARLQTAARRGMGADNDTSSTWYGSLWSAAATMGAGIFGSAVEYKRAKDAEKLMAKQAEIEAARAQQQAVTAIQQRDYAAQLAQLKQMQIEGEQQQLDTLLMFGGFALAALVGAKLLKVI